MLIGSIDISNGKAVQLRQGKELIIESDRNPIDLAREFNRFGEVAVIDLDAALGKGNNTELIERICAVADVRVGGGIRNTEVARRFLKAGAQKLIFGTRAEPEFLSRFPKDVVMVALDHRNGEVTDHGWQETTGESVIERAGRLADYCSSFLCTFVEHEGSLNGIPLAEVRNLGQRLSKSLTVAGGVASEKEIVEISKLGIDVQVGMALYKGLIDPIRSTIESLTFGDNNLIPTIVQDEHRQTLMLAYSSPASLQSALHSGKGVYHSRSRQSLWEKGLTSGNVQELIACRADCDRDALLFTVRQKNVCCHTNAYSCFQSGKDMRQYSLPTLFELLKKRKVELLSDSYSTTLFKDRRKLLKKIIEEAVEVTTYDSRDNLRWEIADLLYFLSVLAVDEGVEWREIETELAGRRKPQS